MSADPPAIVPPAAKPRPKPVRGPNLGLDVDPRESQWRSLTWREQLQRVWFSLGAGVGVSVVLHAIVLIAMGLWIYQLPRENVVDTYIADWFDSSHLPANAKGKRKPVGLPVNINAVPSSPGEGAAKTVPPKDVLSTAAPAPGVKPVNVGQQAFGNRGVGAGGSGRGTGGGGGTGGDGLEALGGSYDAQRAVKAGLAWLARQQTNEGKWELHQGYPDAAFKVIRTDTGATALALLAFLGTGATHLEGEHAAVVKKGLKWLVDVQDPNTGDLHDQRQEEGRQPAFYAHSMATLVLCETLALTQDDTFRGPAEKAVRYLLDSQHPEFGGWKYRPISKQMTGDLSVTGWALMALHTARIAGIDINEAEFERASRFLDSVQEQRGARYKYEPQDPPQRVTAALTAEGLLCRQWMGWPKDHPPMVDGLTFLLSPENRAEWSGGRRNVYGWYYMAQMLHNLGGESWQTWYPPVRDLVVRHQVTGGGGKGNDVRGSWHPTQPPGMGEEYGDKAGRLYVTVMCLLILETPYRHKPLYGEAGGR
ncbi:MAG: terpene cyclase/mutase family protein [Planctomycetaceae bacterium]|nr:terpene cyclase/mutase family protein [Planctomycetaceae bacterium]